MITIEPTRDPQAALRGRREEFARGKRDSDGFAFEYSLTLEFLPDSPTIELLAVAVFRREAEAIRTALTVCERDDELLRGLNCLRSEWDVVHEWCDAHEHPWLELDKPLRLRPVHIPKPWGQEIWYTGIEARGQSRVADESGRSLPLPWLLSFCADELLGAAAGRDLILLKVLDPLPKPVFGDLYFEMHEEKREVYVVTHVDETAWPNGEGGIRFGFDQHKRAGYPDDTSFKSDYLQAVRAYRELRERIDSQLDERRRKEGIALDAALDADTLEAWLAELPAELRQQEAERRAHMETFIHVDPLRPGDVVTVPTLTPHSLLHGVRTVEFQTPVYERKILSFAQKVLTQSHWDTEAALEQVRLDAPQASELPVLARDDHHLLEEVVEFEDFRVERLTLEAGQQFRLSDSESYSLVMALSPGLSLGGRRLEAEEAMLVSAAESSTELRNDSDAAQIALLAQPV